MSNNDKSNQNNSSETVTVTTEDPKRIEELEKQLEEKNTIIEDIKNKTSAEINEIKQKTSDAIMRIKEDAKKSETRTSEAEVKDTEIETNLPARIINQKTFGVGYRNGYSDGTVKKATKELRSNQRKARVGQ